MSKPGPLLPSLLVVLSFCLACSPRSGLRLAPAPSTNSDLQRLLTSVGEHPQRMARLTTRASGRVEGNDVNLRGDSVLVATEQGVRAFAVLQVDSLWSQGTAAALVGMVAALPCAIFGSMVGDFIGGDPDGNGTPRRALIYSLIGLAVGGALCGTAGAIFGSFIPRWRLEYVRSGGRHDQVQGILP
jgi:hypothetical protein